MYQLANTYTLTLESGQKVVFSPDPEVDNWAGHLIDIAITSDASLSSNSLPGIHGAVIGDRTTLGALNITMEVLITGADPIERAMTLRRLDALSAAYQEDITLTWREADGIERQIANLRKSQFSPVGHQSDGPSKKRVFSFIAPLPYIETRREHQTTALITTAGTGPFNTATATATAINAGSANAWPELRVYGPFSRAEVAVTGVGSIIIVREGATNSSTRPLVDGEFVLIKTKPTERGVWFNGASIYKDINWLEATFPHLPPGESEVRIDARGSQTNKTKLVVRSRSSWLM